ncbi:hypothetical protein CDAR_62931 [Caerostris darwini]|uniref:Uncharacterized protein n=1 Tax=Caerostris darwini TaxID=1538125 RepID=A0AAV4UF77_9ARAC|nr:hypothetical protein CDAR_62931 [Caerostris darwini]
MEHPQSRVPKLTLYASEWRGEERGRDSLQKPVAPIRVESARQQNKHGYRPTDKCPPPHATAHTDSARVRPLKNDSPSKGSQKYTKTLLYHEIFPSTRGSDSVKLDKIE